MTLEDLRKCARYKSEIKRLKNEIKSLESKAEKTTTSMSHAPAKTGAVDGMAEDACELVEKREEYNAKKTQYKAHIDRCEEWLLTIPEQQARVLRERELEREENGRRKTWKRIKEIMHYSDSHCRFIYAAAIKRLDQ